MKKYIVEIGSKKTSLRQSTVDRAAALEDKNGYPVYMEESASDLALTLACERFYGKNAFFWKGSGTRGIGQVCKPCRTGGNTCITPTVSYGVEEV